MKIRRLSAAVVIACLSAAVLRGDDPAVPEIKLIKPSIDKNAGVVTLPGAFWNELQAEWVEVAFCGRPSDFLHETVVSATTTRTALVDAMHIAGFRDADAWVDNPADFPRIRGDKALILIDVELEGKKETFALDEVIAFHGWNVSVGPYGWMFKGDAGHSAAATAPATQPVQPRVDPGIISDAMRIMTDDPQVALQFRGLQHVSRSFIDYPLAYLDWVIPDFDYVRNMAVEPASLPLGKPDPKDAVPGETAAAAHKRLLQQFWTRLYNSNGTVPVTIRLLRVNEEQFLTEAAKVWHDPVAAKFMLEQIDTAKQIDKDKAEWLELLPKVRKMAAEGRVVDPEKPIARSAEFTRMSILAATIEKNYAALDAAWAIWAADHPQFGDDPTVIDTLKLQCKVWKEHLQLVAEHAAQMLIVEQALAEAALIQQKGDTPENRRALQIANGRELEARSRGMIAANKQALDEWKYKRDILKADDPRTEMKREIMTQLALAEARVAAGEAGITCGKAMQSGDAAALGPAQDAYKKAALTLTITGLEVKLADVDFEISKREGTDDTDLPGMIKQRDAWRAELKAAQAATTRP